MNQHERSHHDNPPAAPAGPDASPTGANLNAIRQAGTAMLAAADEAISRVLSGDSQAFNAAVQQDGGQ